MIAKQYRSRLPYFDRIWNVPDVFTAADEHYYLWRNRLRVAIPRTPHIAHWTYPLPMRIPGAKNIYTLHDLGHKVEVLYPSRASRGYNRLLREIAFFDPLVGDLPWWILALLRI